MEQPCKHEPVCAFGLAERQAVDPKNFQCRVQELERVAFSAIAPLCHVYPDLVLYRPTGLPLCQKLMTDPAGSPQDSGFAIGIKGNLSRSWGMHHEFECANSYRPKTARGANQQWMRPRIWIGTPLYFEIFQLNSSQKWKVSLIAEQSQNPKRLSDLRNAASFLISEFGWKLPQGATKDFDGKQTRAVYLSNYGLQQDATIAQAQAEKIVLATLRHPRWQEVLAVL